MTTREFTLDIIDDFYSNTIGCTECQPGYSPYLENNTSTGSTQIVRMCQLSKPEAELKALDQCGWG